MTTVKEIVLVSPVEVRTTLYNLFFDTSRGPTGCRVDLKMVLLTRTSRPASPKVDIQFYRLCSDYNGFVVYGSGLNGGSSVPYL